ncbi:ABC transporter permease [Pluralibacter gergoviae]|uniref:ABC transporter permease n=1 Tax=Pluralibacter gergoviae TaxID=61647 RepID=UPI000A61925B|nr:ABC transporter permease [Pluralibacter gergoviae]EKV0931052.1 ABC transporter permease [Pluralibacter gergoviae]EKV6247796.1 ABC transporter permease [Pluralibacter gergoviae]EKW9964648.1 ABC transporter permease [Pluralibacter gergoviae]ELD4270136.1 ABC transporter permease [Pluralibacter gergoviae]ELD4275116.1 ABC transporter permease [Pluralibacter gergoviae]
MILRGRGKALLWRLGQAVATLWLLSFIIFSALALAKGDAATARLAGSGSAQQVRDLRAQLGLDKPLLTRYRLWLGGALRGDLGTSYLSGRPVSELLLDRGRFSLALGACASLLLLLLAFSAGIWCGLRPGGAADRLIGTFSLVLAALPEFVTGTLLVLLFALTLRWLPALSLVSDELSLWAQWPLFILPVLTLVSVCLAQNIRLIRAGVMRASASAACESARLNGVAERRVVLHWVLPEVLSYVLPVLARYITYLFGGALIAETLFGWPGLAASLLNATLSRDTPVVMGIAMAICCLTVLLNALADGLTALFTPAAGREGQ